MYIQSKGELQHLPDKLLFTNGNDCFEIDGEDMSNFNKLFPYLTGTVPLIELSKIVGIEEQDLLEFFYELENKGLVMIGNKPFMRASLISEGLDKKKLNELFDIPTLNHVISITNLADIHSDNTDIVIVIDSDESEFFPQVQNYLSTIKVPWIKFSFSYSKIFMGPIFFPDGGPCFNCFQSRVSRTEKSAKINKSLGDLESYFAPLIEKELLKFCREKTPIQCFNTEIVLDTEALEIIKYPVFQMPDCLFCRGEVYV
ncbi:hypothetical protein [Lysinibacillus sp. NPDC092081]|uniref:hypothetical protein n=1 Tax=Lysinibacillus sp. NPDC092081 TaxID=3364131 RepID=UPI0037F89B3C